MTLPQAVNHRSNAAPNGANGIGSSANSSQATPSLFPDPFAPNNSHPLASVYQTTTSGYDAIRMDRSGIAFPVSVTVSRSNDFSATPGRIEDIFIATTLKDGREITYQLSFSTAANPELASFLQREGERVLQILGQSKASPEGPLPVISATDWRHAISLVRANRALMRELKAADAPAFTFSRHQSPSVELLTSNPFDGYSSSGNKILKLLPTEGAAVRVEHVIHSEIGGGPAALGQQVVAKHREFGIEPDNWNKSQKGVSHLVKELTDGDSHIYFLRGGEQREVILSGAAVILDIECQTPPELLRKGKGPRLKLVETRRIINNKKFPGRISKGGLPGEKMHIGEEILEAGQRALREELSIGTGPKSVKELFGAALAKLASWKPAANICKELSYFLPDKVANSLRKAAYIAAPRIWNIKLTHTGTSIEVGPSANYAGVLEARVLFKLSGEVPYRDSFIEVTHGREITHGFVAPGKFTESLRQSQRIPVAKAQINPSKQAPAKVPARKTASKR